MIFYLGVWFAFFKASVITELEYRLNITLRIFTDIIWYTAQISVFRVLFLQSPKIGGWTLEQTQVFLGVLFFVDSIWMLLFSENLDRFSDKVRKGDLDMMLAKPVNSQFTMSMNKVSAAYIGNLFIAFGFLVYALLELNAIEPVNWVRMLWLLLFVPCGVVICYCLRFFFSASALYLVRAENISYLWYQIYKLGTRPDSFYPKWLRYLILSIMPVGFIASVPSQMIFGEQTYIFVPLVLVMSAVTLYLSSKYWNWALKHYTSASS
ncbi:MAG: ABC transporter permease [Bdellovibrionales bacterium]